MMIRYVLRRTNAQTFRLKNFNRSKSDDSNKKRIPGSDIAYEAEYYYKQDKELLEILKQKTQDEVKTMQEEIQTMRNKIDEYNRDINENLRFLKGLENSLSNNKKGS